MIYFDNSATTKTDDSVLQTYQSVSDKYFGNASSLHTLGEQSQQLLHQSRKQIAQLLNVKPARYSLRVGEQKETIGPSRAQPLKNSTTDAT